MDVGTYHFTRDPESPVPSMTWMLTWQHFLEVRLGTCVESWVEQKVIGEVHSVNRTIYSTYLMMLGILFGCGDLP